MWRLIGSIVLAHITPVGRPCLCIPLKLHLLLHHLCGGPRICWCYLYFISSVNVISADSNLEDPGTIECDRNLYDIYIDIANHPTHIDASTIDHASIAI